MKHSLAALVAASAVGLLASAGNVAIAMDAVTLGNNDSVLIDATSFKIAQGKPKGDLADLVKKGAARELSGGAILFRAGDKLYLIATGANAERDAADPRRMMYDSAGRYVPDPAKPFAYDGGDPRRMMYDSAGRYVPDPAKPFAYDGGDPRRMMYDSAGRYVPDPSRPFAYDGGDPRRLMHDPARPSSVVSGGPSNVLINNPAEGRSLFVNDPDYAQYKLKKMFEENWTSAVAKP